MAQQVAIISFALTPVSSLFAQPIVAKNVIRKRRSVRGKQAGKRGHEAACGVSQSEEEEGG